MANALEAGSTVVAPRATLDARGRPLIEVRDNGQGMSERTRNSIFVPFYTTRAEGSGIGLALSRQIMLLHGGSIDVDTTPGRGSTYNAQVLNLPRAAVPAPAGRRARPVLGNDEADENTRSDRCSSAHQRLEQRR